MSLLVGLGVRRRGSRRISRHTRPRARPQIQDPTPLATALGRLGVGSFTAQSAEAYKARVVQDSSERFQSATRQIDSAVRFDALCNAKDLVPNGMVAAVILAAISGFLAAPLHQAALTAGWSISSGLLGTCIFLLASAGFSAVVAYYRYRPQHKREAWLQKLQLIADRNARWRWSPVPLEQFDGTLPGPIADLARDIRSEAPPGTVLLVDRVEVDAVPNATEISDRARAFANDPFLVVELPGRERHVVAVWDDRVCRIARHKDEECVL